MKAERAKIFIPFSPLNGFYEAIRKKEHISVPKAEISEDMACEIDEALKSVRAGDMVTVVYYCVDEYLSVTGCVSKIDVGRRILTLVTTQIHFDDIYKIEEKI